MVVSFVGGLPLGQGDVGAPQAAAKGVKGGAASGKPRATSKPKIRRRASGSDLQKLSSDAGDKDRRPSLPALKSRSRRGSDSKLGTIEVRSKTWEEKRREHIEELRQGVQTEITELKPVQPKPSSRWKHVQSAIKLSATHTEGKKRRSSVTKAAKKEEQQRVARVEQLRTEIEERLRKEAEDADNEARQEIHRMVEESIRLRKEKEAKARAIEEEKAREVERRRQEVLTAFGPSGLERRQSMPSKMVFRVADPAPDVTNEYRVKDRITRTRGVSLLMGQTLARTEDRVQCVLFDESDFDEVSAARWWNDNKDRFSDGRGGQ